ncbi:MAG: 30S ribosomal protein S21 [Archangium sp.]|jgi:small subunit ribosomal protein S21|nr:30S ribosomal protein S21 [Archangium sp.]
MTTIKLKDGESIEGALKRFKKATEKAGILSEIRKREHYEKPSVKKKKKAIAAKKRAVKKNRRSY